MWVILIILISPSDDDAARRLAFLRSRDDGRRAEIRLVLEALRGLEQLVDELRARFHGLFALRFRSESSIDPPFTNRTATVMMVLTNTATPQQMPISCGV